MSVKHPFFLHLIICIFFTGHVCADENSQDLKVFPVPSWIKPQKPDSSKIVPEDQIRDGIYYLLSDRQIRVNSKNEVESYQHYADKVVNQSGLSKTSVINISYDPIYEVVQWHHISILRDGKVIPKEGNLKVNLLRREKELENSIYNGRLTINIILDDLRVGDVVDYSYSLIGSNPIYGQHFADVEAAEWSVPLGNFHFYMDWGRESPLHLKLFNTDIKPTITKTNGRQTYELNLENIKAKTINSQTPPWYNPYARYYFSDTNNWKDIIKWAVPLYDSASKSSPEIVKVLEEIKSQGGSTVHQAALALHYVQDNIRYLGVEMGQNSHQPSLAEDTLKRRYGDCKDKAVLLITLLRELGIEAAPALVNTSARRELINHLPSIKSFDHVIVHIKIGKKIYWVDPTREFQKGDLEVTYQSNYGYGLVIAENSDDLVKMESDNNSNEKIVENIDVSGAFEDPAKYTVRTEYSGYEAELQRSIFLGSNTTEKSEQYMEFYKGYYDHIRTTEKINTQDNPLTNVYSVTESYVIDKIWDDKSKPKYTATFYGSGIASAFKKPEDTVRTSPLHVTYKNVREVIHIKLDDSDWSIDDERFEVNNKYFEFNNVVQFNKEKAELTLEFFYRTLVDTIPAEETAEYLALRTKVIDRLEYGIMNTAGGADSISDDFWFGLAAVVIYLLIFIYTFADWYRDKTRFHYLSDSKFYPIAAAKFIVLSVITLGSYSIYWFYRNWAYVRRVDSSNILPFARAFFSGFWVYSFYNRLVMEEESKDVRFLPRSKWVAACVALLYFVLWLASDIDKYGALFTVLAPLMLLPFALHILHIPQENNLALKNNSRWKLRHYFLVLISFPLFAFVVGLQSGLLNGAQVVKGSHIMSYDKRFLQRKKIVSASEEIVYFYSPGLIDVRDSGGGFTKESVFSYWHDGDELIVKRIPFSRIKDIQLNDGSGEGQSLNITDDKSDEFILYLSDTARDNRTFVRKINEIWNAQKK